MGDVAERKLWDKYMDAYEDAIRATSRAEAPWYVVPADNKWFARLVVAEAMVEAMESLKLEFPKVEGGSAEGIGAGATRAAGRGPKGAWLATIDDLSKSRCQNASLICSPCARGEFR